MTRALAVIASLAISLGATALAQESRTFHPYTIQQIAQASPTDWHGLFLSHVEVIGYVTYKKHEADGDWHLRVCDAPDVKGMDKDRCIVAEIIPENPFARP